MTTAFVGSNVLIYAASGRPADAKKAQVARELLKSGPFCVSVQVLNKFTAIAVKPEKLGMSREEATLYCRVWEAETPVHSLTPDHLEIAREWFVPGRLSLWDSLILASARLAGCTKLYSEDFNAGQDYGGTTAINPFS